MIRPPVPNDRSPVPRTAVPLPPGARLPDTTTGPPMVPLPVVKAPPDPTVAPPARVPPRASVPPLTVAIPVNVWLAGSYRVPAPVFTSPWVPLMTPPSVELPSWEIVTAPVPVAMFPVPVRVPLLAIAPVPADPTAAFNTTPSAPFSVSGPFPTVLVVPATVSDPDSVVRRIGPALAMAPPMVAVNDAGPVVLTK